MKKLFYLFSQQCLFILLVLPVLISCSSSDDDEPKYETVESQQNKIEEVALDFMNEFDTKELDELKSLLKYISNEYCSDNYNSNTIDNWCENILDDITITRYSHSGQTYGYGEYDRYYRASNFVGSFTASNGTWYYQQASTLKFNVKDAEGRDCVAELVTEGAEKKVFAGNTTDESYDYYNYWDSYYERWYEFYKYKYESYDNYVYVPEKVIITFTRDGEILGKFVLKTDLSSMGSDKFNLNTDNYNVSATIIVENYEYVLNKMFYTPNGNPFLQCQIKHNNKNLLDITVSGSTTTVEETVQCNSANVSIDIMGGLQIKGDCNINEFTEILSVADEYYDDEVLFKKYVDKANEKIALSLYYDGTDTKQADIVMKSYYDNNYKQRHCYYTPAILLNNGASYTFEEFFGDEEFKNVINAFNDLMRDY